MKITGIRGETEYRKSRFDRRYSENYRLQEICRGGAESVAQTRGTAEAGVDVLGDQAVDEQGVRTAIL